MALIRNCSVPIKYNQGRSLLFWKKFVASTKCEEKKPCDSCPSPRIRMNCLPFFITAAAAAGIRTATMESRSSIGSIGSSVNVNSSSTTRLQSTQKARKIRSCSLSLSFSVSVSRYSREPTQHHHYPHQQNIVVDPANTPLHNICSRINMSPPSRKITRCYF